MNVARGLGLLLVGFLAVSAAGVATGHGNHIAAMPQVVDGQVVVESFFMLREGWIVIHADDGGDPGEILGHTDASMGSHEAVSVTVDDGKLPGDGTVTLWAVLHRDDGDGEFEPKEDPPLESFGSLAGTTFTARRGDGQVVVVAPGRDGQPTNGTVRIRQVSTQREGFVALHDVERGSVGEPVGHAALSPGSHRNVSVRLDEAYFESESNRFDLEAVVYVDDGDGEFEPDQDTPVAVGDERVSSRIAVRKVASNASAGNESGDGSIVVTATTSGNRTSVETVADDPGGGGGPMPAPGFGPVAALVALVAVALLLAARRR